MARKFLYIVAALIGLGVGMIVRHTAAAITGPARQPRPTSSTPATRNPSAAPAASSSE